jgi:small subunit ribosomal protein S6
MRPYEVMVIFDPGLEEEPIRATLDRLAELVRSRGGTVGRVDHWGKRRLAYELRHRTEGYYVLVDVGIEPETVAELDRMLFLTDEVIRHKVVHAPAAARARTGAATTGTATPAASPDANGA